MKICQHGEPRYLTESVVLKHRVVTFHFVILATEPLFSRTYTLIFHFVLAEP